MIQLDELVLQAREQLTELPESRLFSRENLAALVPAAIARWQERTALDRDKRQNFVVGSKELAVEAGRLDLQKPIDTYGFRLEYLQDGDIELAYNPADADGNRLLPTTEIKLVKAKNRLLAPGIQDKFFILAYLSGTTLMFRDPTPADGADPLESFYADVIIRSVVMPRSLFDVPESVLPELALELAALARAEFTAENRGLNFLPKS